ncbi:serine protease [Rhodococcus spelaei]|uniref:Serine protease n=1 Tax=Rhodococcus spelaei TaxID=2546320 RepID=A0A541AZA8_9NOCA|nr:NfeD family protein [Rhodococcus spelaei]TQF65409.1 serine protease [Rhodococcus spelaei]
MATFGVVAVLLGLLLILVEAHTPTSGVLGGIAVLAIGAGVWMLFLSGGAGQVVAVPIALGVAGIGLGVTAVAGRKVVTSRRAPVRGGPQSLVGSHATVSSWSGPTGQVRADGGLWSARIEFGYPDDPVPAAGESVVVEGVHGLTLTVRRPEPWEVPL